MKERVKIESISTPKARSMPTTPGPGWLKKKKKKGYKQHWEVNKNIQLYSKEIKM